MIIMMLCFNLITKFVRIIPKIMVVSIFVILGNWKSFHLFPILAELAHNFHFWIHNLKEPHLFVLKHSIFWYILPSIEEILMLFMSKNYRSFLLSRCRRKNTYESSEDIQLINYLCIYSASALLKDSIESIFMWSVPSKQPWINKNILWLVGFNWL